MIVTRMSSDDLDIRPTSTHLLPQPVVEELGRLLRELHGLLESYAPPWYTEEIDTRVSETLTKFTLPTCPPRI
jgi:hypothetical protein